MNRSPQSIVCLDRLAQPTVPSSQASIAVQRGCGRAVDLLELTPPDGAARLATPPLGRVRADHERSWMNRQPLKHRVGIAVTDRL